MLEQIFPTTTSKEAIEDVALRIAEDEGISLKNLSLPLLLRLKIGKVEGVVKVSRRGPFLNFLVKNGVPEKGQKQKYLSFGEGTKVIEVL